MDGLSRFVRQTKDTYKGPCRTVVSTPPMGGVRTRDGNMPALKEISFEYARQIASVKGLQPGKVKGTSTLRFTKGDSDKLQVITWDEFVQTANNRNLAVYESGGWVEVKGEQPSRAPRKPPTALRSVPPPSPPSFPPTTRPAVGPSFSSLPLRAAP